MSLGAAVGIAEVREDGEVIVEVAEAGKAMATVRLASEARKVRKVIEVCMAD